MIDKLPSFEVGEGLVLSCLIFYQISSFVVAYLILSLNLVGPAPYGRYKDRQWWAGPNVPARAAWVVQECPAILIPAGYLFFTGKWHKMFMTEPSANSWLLLAVCVHYFYRSFVFPMLIRGSKPASLLTMQVATTVCIISGLIHTLALCSVLRYPAGWTSDVRFLAGLALFAAGMLLNIQSDSILRNLRKPGEAGYKIPEGGLFKYVSCANYFAEIIEWTGFAIAGWSVPTSVMVIITCLNLVPRAVTHHKWYKEKFDEYPSRRKILIPFVF